MCRFPPRLWFLIIALCYLHFVCISVISTSRNMKSDPFQLRNKCNHPHPVMQQVNPTPFPALKLLESNASNSQNPTLLKPSNNSNPTTSSLLHIQPEPAPIGLPYHLPHTVRLSFRIPHRLPHPQPCSPAQLASAPFCANRF